MAAPQINWGDMLAQATRPEQRAHLAVDLRSIWEETLVGKVKLTNGEAFDPQQVWQWPAPRFGAGSKQAVSMQAGERLVARITVFSERVGTDFNLSFAMPRLDAAHVSYRYDGGPWTTLSAGDTLAMNRWPLADRQPSFYLPLIAGQMDVVIQIAHRGILESPVMLQSSRVFLESRTSSVWSAGLYVGVSLVLALMGFLMALNFKRSGFLCVTVMSTMVALVLSFDSGLGGMYVGVNSDRLNDEVKFIVNTSWSMLLPWVTGMALGIRSYSKLWWWGAVASAITGVFLAIFWADYSARDATPGGIPVLLFFVIFFTIAMLSWAWLKGYSRNWGIVIGVALYMLSLGLPFAAFVGVISSDGGGQWTAFISMLAALAFMRGLFLQHRMGRQVIARANLTTQRDVLTGLLSRLGAQTHLNRVRVRTQNEHTCALFIYASTMDSEAAIRAYGEEGFEMGMVQIAASLSSSVSGVDGLARISHHAFGIIVMMPPDPALATRLAQKILARLMALASHGTPMAGSVRMVMAWLPLYGFKINTLERRCVRTLEMLEENKRIGWVGGNASHSEAAQLLRDARHDYQSPIEMEDLGAGESQPPRDSAVSSNIYERIHRIEREMLHGMDTRFLVADAERTSHLNVGSGLSPSEAVTTQSMGARNMSTQPPGQGDKPPS